MFLGDRVLAGDEAALRLVEQAIAEADGDLDLASRSLGVEYCDLAEWWRRTPRLDAWILRVRKKR